MAWTAFICAGKIRKWKMEELAVLRKALGKHARPPIYGEIEAIQSACPSLVKNFGADQDQGMAFGEKNKPQLLELLR